MKGEALEKIKKFDIYDMYINQNLSLLSISKIVGVSDSSIRRYCLSNGIPIKTRDESSNTDRVKNKKSLKSKPMSNETKQKISESKYKGGIGYKKKRGDGYIIVYFPDHPKSNSEGLIMEHILVAEAVLGRHLKDNEVVHHVNYIRDDNRAENLEVMDRREHAAFHSKERHKDSYPFNYATVSVINLDTGEIFESIKSAANKYNISPSRISYACRNNKTAAKYRWAYYKKDEVEK